MLCAHFVKSDLINKLIYDPMLIRISKRGYDVKGGRKSAIGHDSPDEIAMLAAMYQWCTAPGLSSLGSLDGVNLLFFGFHNRFHMGGHVAVSIFPFQSWRRCCCAVFTGFILGNSLTAFTLLHHGQAGPAIIFTAAFGHENTFITLSYSITNHWYQPHIVMAKKNNGNPTGFPPCNYILNIF